jgi:hypothetical protein
MACASSSPAARAHLRVERAACASGSFCSENAFASSHARDEQLEALDDARPRAAHARERRGLDRVIDRRTSGGAASAAPAR